jgi:hypothetical protein
MSPYLVCTAILFAAMAALRWAINLAFASSADAGYTLCALVIGASLLTGAVVDYRAGRLWKPKWPRRAKDLKSFG